MGRMYFTQDHENAILKYCVSEDRAEKEVLYGDWIQPVFNEMVDKIVFAYKFTSLPNIDELRMECKVWLTTILDKYDPNRGSKAFSYFSVITKNWFIHKVKVNSKKQKREVSYENIVEMGGSDSLGATQEEPDYSSLREEAEFWNHLLCQVDSWDTGNLKVNEKSVLEAVKVLLHNMHGLLFCPHWEVTSR